jgi:hypothetical protein
MSPILPVLLIVQVMFGYSLPRLTVIEMTSLDRCELARHALVNKPFQYLEAICVER